MLLQLQLDGRAAAADASSRSFEPAGPRGGHGGLSRPFLAAGIGVNSQTAVLSHVWLVVSRLSQPQAVQVRLDVWGLTKCAGRRRRQRSCSHTYRRCLYIAGGIARERVMSTALHESAVTRLFLRIDTPSPRPLGHPQDRPGLA